MKKKNVKKGSSRLSRFTKKRFKSFAPQFFQRPQTEPLEAPLDKTLESEFQLFSFRHLKKWYIFKFLIF